MNPKQVVALRTMIKESYPYAKLDSETGDDVWYMLLKDYKFQPMRDALIHYIKEGNKWAPGISELIQLSKSFQNLELNEVVDYMDNQGYFDDNESTDAETAVWNHDNRLKKTMQWIKSNSVPGWLKEDINKYYRELHPTQVGSSNKAKMIGG